MRLDRLISISREGKKNTLKARVEGSFGSKKGVHDASSIVRVAGCAGDRARVAHAGLHLRPVSNGRSERETRRDQTLDSATDTGRPARPSRHLVEQRRHSAGTAEGTRRKTIPDRRGSGCAEEECRAALRRGREQRRRWRRQLLSRRAGKS